MYMILSQGVDNFESNLQAILVKIEEWSVWLLFRYMFTPIASKISQSKIKTVPFETHIIASYPIADCSILF